MCYNVRVFHFVDIFVNRSFVVDKNELADKRVGFKPICFKIYKGELVEAEMAELVDA